VAPPQARASAAAAEAQARYQRAGLRAYALSTLAVAAMAVAVVFSAHHAVAIAACLAELAILSALVVGIHRAHRAGLHRGWLERRLLAERLRTLFFQVACGRVPEPSAERSAGLLATEARPWVDAAVAEVLAALPRGAPPAEAERARLAAFLRARWVVDQLRYHREKEVRSGRANRRLQAAGVALFGGAIAVSLLHLGLSWLALRTHADGGLTLAVTLPAAGAATNGYRTLMELSRQARRSGAMAAELERIEAAWPREPDPAALDAALARLEEVTQLEAQDWVQVMSFSDLSSIG
jgi:hypothetical protein